jgi:uncharacterized protein (DUF1015 family)
MFLGKNNTKHQIWIIKEDEDINDITREINYLVSFIIADGHIGQQRASRIAKEETLNQAAGENG